MNELRKFVGGAKPLPVTVSVTSDRSRENARPARYTRSTLLLRPCRTHAVVLRSERRRLTSIRKSTGIAAFVNWNWVVPPGSGILAIPVINEPIGFPLAAKGKICG